MSDRSSDRVPRPWLHGRSPAAIGLVAGIYTHFLIFAQFGLLQGIREAGLAADAVHRVLGAMALAGIVSSVIAATALARNDARWVAGLGLGLAAIAGALAALSFASGWLAFAMLLGVAVLTGAGLGMATVATAVLLRRFTGGRSIGTHVGAGTGLAYLVCNIPAVFSANPTVKAWIAALAALAAVGCALAGRSRPETDAFTHLALGSTRAVAMAALAFLALVWFDSAAFAVVQNAAELRAAVWSGPVLLLAIGVAHAAAAVVAGVMIDRGSLRLGLFVAFALLVVGHVGFTSMQTLWPAPVYAAGVSIYSTALAAFAALAPASPGLPPGWRAAWIYSLAGWMASAAGVGLAEQFGRVPLWAAPAAGVVLLASVVQLPRTP